MPPCRLPTLQLSERLTLGLVAHAARRGVGRLPVLNDAEQCVIVIRVEAHASRPYIERVFDTTVSSTYRSWHEGGKVGA